MGECEKGHSASEGCSLGTITVGRLYIKQVSRKDVWHGLDSIMDS